MSMSVFLLTMTPKHHHHHGLPNHHSSHDTVVLVKLNQVVPEVLFEFITQIVDVLIYIGEQLLILL